MHHYQDCITNIWYLHFHMIFPFYLLYVFVYTFLFLHLCHISTSCIDQFHSYFDEAFLLFFHRIFLSPNVSRYNLAHLLWSLSDLISLPLQPSILTNSWSQSLKNINFFIVWQIDIIFLQICVVVILSQWNGLPFSHWSLLV